MAKSFKSLLGDDIKNTRTLLHEAIPVTGTIVSGTYSDNNIKTFSHGMYESVYDYPYLSSSANHIFDLTYGCSTNVSSSANTQNAKKLNMYNQMTQVLFGYDLSGSIRKFDSDGSLDTVAGTMDHCFFINFSRLLCKDEVKKNTFRLALKTAGTVASPGTVLTLGDYDAGKLFYQAGVAVLTSSIFTSEFGPPSDGRPTIAAAQTGSTIQQLADGLRHRFHDLDFNNTIELNSAIYFCRINHNEFNYSSNPTYLSGSKLVIKNQSTDLPITYITTIGLYSPDNELMAVAKLSEPIRKDPNTELTLRVRLDY